MREELTSRLQAIEQAGLHRAEMLVSPFGAPGGVEVEVSGRAVINLASNDYLGLARHPALRRAASGAAQEHGVGAGSARLVTGTHQLHRSLERRLAQMLGVQRVQLIGSGYLAHIGTIPALAGEGDVIFSDALNHASVVDGCRLSRARVQIFRHADVGHLADLLEQERGRGGQHMIITETVFSMDGDEAPLVEICELAEGYGAWVMVDEAHAFGLRGRRGAGLVSALGLEDRVHVRMGTLSKAAGCYGAFLGGSVELVDYLINRSRSFIYSTALPLPVVAAAIEALELIGGSEGEHRRAALDRASGRLRRGLREQGWTLPCVPGPILPLMVGDPAEAMALCGRLLEEGVLVRAMRYPTVPRGTERLRLIASADLSEAHLERVVAAFDRQRGHP